jgi:hypothetical protein
MLDKFEKYNALLENIEEKDKKIFLDIVRNSGYMTEAVEKFLVEQELNEAPTVASDVPIDAKIMIPLINSAFIGSIAKNLVNIQPISIPRQVVFSPVIKDNLDKIIIGGGEATWFPPSPYVGVEAADLTGEALVSFENITMSKSDANFFNRKVKLTLTREMVQDIKNLFGIDYYNENIKAAANVLSMILDYDIVHAITSKINYAGRTYNYVWDSTRNENVWDAPLEIMTLINKASSDMARETRKGLADWMIVSPMVFGVISRLQAFEPIKQVGDSVLVVAGKVSNMLVVINTLADDTDRSIYIGKKAPQDNNGGIIYAPYKTEITDEAIGYDDFGINRGIISRYGIAIPKNADYFYRKINILVSEEEAGNFPYYNYGAVIPVPATADTSTEINITANMFLSKIEFAPDDEVAFNLAEAVTSTCALPGIYTEPTSIVFKVYNYTEETGDIYLAPILNGVLGTPQAETIAVRTSETEPSVLTVTISFTAVDNNSVAIRRIGADVLDTLDADVYFKAVQVNF